MKAKLKVLSKQDELECIYTPGLATGGGGGTRHISSSFQVDEQAKTVNRFLLLKLRISKGSLSLSLSL
jgi:hypothetical protein